MTIAGILGGVGPESTLEYYRQIIASYRARRPDGSYPTLVINSVDLNRMVGYITAGNITELAAFLHQELERLVSAGAHFLAIASNTPHLCFDELRRRSSLPIISIVESARDEIASLGLKRVGLFGTRFTMQAGFYDTALSQAGISLAVPTAEEQTWIHDRYMGELLLGILLPETRDRLTAIAESMRSRDGIEALVLGGTELPLILDTPAVAGLPVIDTTKVHVRKIVDRLLEE